MALQFYLKNICRTCLSDEYLIDIQQFGEPLTRLWIREINSYFKIQILLDDDFSKKLCVDCLEKIVIWHKHIAIAKECQVVLDILANMKKERMERQQRDS